MDPITTAAPVFDGEPEVGGKQEPGQEITRRAAPPSIVRDGRRPLPPDVSPYQVIDIPQIATVLNMTPRHVRRLIKSGRLELPLVRLSDRKVGALFSDVCKLVEQCKTVT